MALRSGNEIDYIAQLPNFDETIGLKTEQSPPKPACLSIGSMRSFLIPLSCGVIVGILATFDLLTGAPRSSKQFATILGTVYSNGDTMIGGEPNRLVPECEYIWLDT